MQINNQKMQFSAGIFFLLLFSSLSLLAQVNTRTFNSRVMGANTTTINSTNITTVKIFADKAGKNCKPKLILQVETANSELTQAYGLSNRKYLPEKQGMLFSFKAPLIGSFWGKNTFIPLDLIYIDSARKITQISQIRPHDLTTIASQSKIQYALELNQGTAEKYGLKIGDQLVWN
jgi:hypothetical protein